MVKGYNIGYSPIPIKLLLSKLMVRFERLMRLFKIDNRDKTPFAPIRLYWRFMLRLESWRKFAKGDKKDSKSSIKFFSKSKVRF